MSVEDLKAARAAQAEQPSEAVEPPKVFTPLRDAIDAFHRREATEVSGAPSRGQKSDLLRADEAQVLNPDAALRWVSPAKAASRKADGYVALSEAEGGKHIGNELILMGIPKQEHERRVAELKRKTAERLDAHKADMQNTAESVARELRDRHGVRVSAEKLLQE